MPGSGRASRAGCALPWGPQSSPLSVLGLAGRGANVSGGIGGSLNLDFCTAFLIGRVFTGTCHPNARLKSFRPFPPRIAATLGCCRKACFPGQDSGGPGVSGWEHGEGFACQGTLVLEAFEKTCWGAGGRGSSWPEFPSPPASEPRIESVPLLNSAGCR